ncbi:unnamed protein product [Penicillium palitans]
MEIIAGVEADKTVMIFSWEAVKTTIGSKGNRYRLWLCMWTAIGSQTIGGGFTASYLPLILDQIGMTSEKEQTLINACINIFNWICAFIAAIIIPRIGRRSIFLFSTLGTNITFLIWTILSERYLATKAVGLGIGVLVMICAGAFFVVLAWIPLVIAYPLETVTTKQRGVYFAITMFTINVTAFFVSYVSPIGLENIGWRYYIPTCVWNVILLLVVYFTFVETTGMTLEEIAVLFDDPGEILNATIAVGKDLEEKRADQFLHVENSICQIGKCSKA